MGGPIRFAFPVAVFVATLAAGLAWSRAAVERAAAAAATGVPPSGAERFFVHGGAFMSRYGLLVAGGLAALAATVSVLRSRSDAGGTRRAGDA